jgi:FkbM family methyltransferase
MKKLFNILRFISSHPLTKDNRKSALFRFLKWQIISRLYPHPIVYPFVERSRLIVKKGMTGATGNIYVGLHEFEDMAFLLHLLRKEDVFGDVGANIGSYTILASGVVNAKTISVEPVPSTFKHLQNNIKINSLDNLVSAFNNGVGATEGILRFTKDFDTVNHVVSEDSISLGDTIQIPIVTLDNLFSNHLPVLLKIDVEGFELNVLKGGKNVLGSNELKAIIIELNSSGKRYGISDQEVHNFLTSYNFLPYMYDPFTRYLQTISIYSGSGNTIYIKDKKFAMDRVSAAREYSVTGKKF